MKDVTTDLMMFHMDLLRNCENTPTVRICDPVKNEAITVWLDETKRKKREAEDEGKKQMDEYRRNKKKQKKVFGWKFKFVHCKIEERRSSKKVMEVESEKKDKEKEEKREIIVDILHTVPRAK